MMSSSVGEGEPLVGIAGEIGMDALEEEIPTFPPHAVDVEMDVDLLCSTLPSGSADHSVVLAGRAKLEEVSRGVYQTVP